MIAQPSFLQVRSFLHFGRLERAYLVVEVELLVRANQIKCMTRSRDQNCASLRPHRGRQDSLQVYNLECSRTRHSRLDESMLSPDALACQSLRMAPPRSVNRVPLTYLSMAKTLHCRQQHICRSQDFAELLRGTSRCVKDR